jgi:hypothetical protein
MTALDKLNQDVDRIEEQRWYREALRAVVSIDKSLQRMLETPKTQHTEKRGFPSHAFVVYKDGDQWCCVFGDFINLQESPAGFGRTMFDAMDALMEALK